MTSSSYHVAVDSDSLFCIVSGGVNGIACDHDDPQLLATGQIAARQLLDSTTEEKEVTRQNCACVDFEVEAEPVVPDDPDDHRGEGQGGS